MRGRRIFGHHIRQSARSSRQSSAMRLHIVANLAKPQVRPALDELQPWLEQRVQLVGVETDHQTDLSQLDVDAILVLGGDGTLLSVARRLKGAPIPLVGVNFGRLGFLASFTLEQFYEHFPALLNGTLPRSRRQIIEASVVDCQTPCVARDVEDVRKRRRFHATALNDAVITAGPPFRMIELELGADDETLVRYYGDGVIVATPSGSTAYNVSAGGPIITPGVDGIVITPICPQSLSFRPVVISSSSTVYIVASRVNQGTTLFCDGQASTHLNEGDKVIIRRSPNDVSLIENPDARKWKTLAEKLHWAISPPHSARGDDLDHR
jgi:NAD+ kinase